MRRILVIASVIIGSLIAVSGLFFIITAVYLDEKAIDLTEPPKLEKCAQTTTIITNSDNAIRISDKVVTAKELGQIINELKQDRPDLCLLFTIHELTEMRMLDEISKIADESGLSWNLVITSD